MFKINIILLVTAIVSIQSVYSKSLPSYIKKCKRTDPDLNKCLKEMLTNIKPRLLKGIPELKIPPYDPLVLPEVTIDQGSSKAVNFKATFRDLTTYGAHKSEFTDAKITLDPEPHVEVTMHFPKLRMISNYEMDGKILVVPIKGKGKSDGNFTDVTAHATFDGKFITKGGKKYISFPTKKVQVSMKNAHFYFANLFNGNKELGESTNIFINENWGEIVREVGPVIDETVAGIVHTFLKNILDQYSYDEIFPAK